MHGFKSNTKMSSTLPCYKTGGQVKKACSGGKMKDGGKVKKAVGGEVKSTIKKAVKQHDENMHGGKTEDIKLKKGGSASKKRMAKKAEGGAMMEKPVMAMPAKKKAKPMAKKAKAPAVKKEVSASKSAKTEVPVLGSPDASAMPAPDLGGMPSPMMKHGGTVHHVHTMASGGQVEHHMDGGMGGAMGGGMAGGAMGGGMGAPAGGGDPRLAMLKKRLAMQAMAGQGAPTSGMSAAPQGGAPMPPQGSMPPMGG